jgi:hypothetical protein
MFGIITAAYMTMVGYWCILVSEPPVPLVMGVLLGINYAYRIFWLYPDFLGVYGKLFGAWAAVCVAFALLGGISMTLQRPYMSSNVALVEEVDSAFNKYGQWKEGAAFPGGFAPTDHLVQAADKELANVWFFDIWVVVFLLFAIPVGFLVAVPFQSKFNASSSGYVPLPGGDGRKLF